MKAMKKLVPAICLLLISAVLLGTSTFAWFSMNTSVTASGMQVQASTSKNLLISNSTGTTYGVSADATLTGVQTLTPCSTSVVTNNVLSAGKFYYVSNSDSIDYSSGAAQTSTTFAEATVTKDSANSYVSANTFKIKVDGGTDDKFTNVYVSSISVTDTTASSNADAEISKALRVAVVTGSYAYIFEPVSGATASYKGVIAAGNGITEGTTIASSNETITAAGTSATIGEVGTSDVEVTIYIWYEGQDAACTSANSVSVETLKVEVVFVGVNDTSTND